jgi:ABC-type dipeptide/oligopeptide/nickel transport system permease subunit
LLDYFIYELDISEQLRNMQYIAADQVLGQNFQEIFTIHSLESSFNGIFFVNSITNAQRKIIEIITGKYLNIGANIEPSQEEQLIALLNKYHKAFAWDILICGEFISRHALIISTQMIT